jgi:hypothetical protein
LTHTCSLYGLGFRVNVPIAGLQGLAAASRVDVILELGAIPAHIETAPFTDWADLFVSEGLDEGGLPAVKVSRHGPSGCFGIRYADGTFVAVDAGGTSVWARGAPGATIEDTATYILGPVLGFLLRLRGGVCLHASAVVIDGRAVAFVGPAGAGKSSIAAGLSRRGHAVLSDDVTPLKDLGDRFEVQPAYPRIRLWPDSVASLFGAADALPRITPTWEKRFLDLNRSDSRFQAAPVELGAIYVLDARRASCAAAPLGRRAALMALVGETSATRLLDRDMRAREFEVLGRLVERVPVRRLHPVDDIARIAELCDFVARDLERLQARAA